ncbi:dynein gamma flagellar outer arm-like, partial [Brachionus plicatilis]
MRAAVRTAGSENKYVGIIFSSKDLFRTEYLDTINSLLNNGECNDLFSNDEMDGLYHAIGPSIKREYPNIIIDPKKFFNTRVRRNLHICLSLQPNGDTFKLILKNYVQIISSCQIYWIKDWTEEALLNEARSFMRERLESDELREKVARCMSEIHSFMLNECRQIPWTGSNEKDIKLPQSPPVKTPTDKKISKTNSTSSM